MINPSSLQGVTAAFTPGPWEVRGSGSIVSVNASCSEEKIARCFRHADAQPFGDVLDRRSRPAPIRSTTIERKRARQLNLRVGVACIILSALTALYFIAQLVRGALS